MTPGREGEPTATGGLGQAVLVIDDNDVDREAIAECLRAIGLTVHDLPSPIGATRTARELNVGVVVIDQNLPAMDGSRLAALFRGNPRMRSIRLVLVSGNDASMMAEIMRQSQADAFVSKRDIQRDLAETVLRLLPPSR
jgi:CheY-like chemotaxis protein